MTDQTKICVLQDAILIIVRAVDRHIVREALKKRHSSFDEIENALFLAGRVLENTTK